MSAVLRTRPSLLPLVVAAAAGIVLVPATIPGTTPNALAAELVSHTQAVVESTGSSISSMEAGAGLSAAALLTHTPTLLRTIPVGNLAHFVALPQSTAPLVDVLGGSGAELRSALAPSLVAAAATDPSADLLAALQSAFGKIQDAFNAAPTNVVTSVGQLLDGDLRTALQTLTNIVIQPLVLIGLVDLPNIATPLAQLAPFFAPVINAIPNIAINISVTALQLFIDGREGIASVFEGVRDGLKAGDLGAAAANFVAGVASIAQNGINDLFGENGLVAALVTSGNDLLRAITQLGAPAAPSSDAVQTLSAATPASPVSNEAAKASPETPAAEAEPETTKTETTKTEAEQETAKTEAEQETAKTEAAKTETEPETAKAEIDPDTKPDTTKPDTAKPDTKSDTTKPDTTKADAKSDKKSEGSSATGGSSSAA